MNQQRKKELATAIKAVCKKWGVKASLGVDHHSTLVLNIRSGPWDIIANANAVARKQAEFRGEPVYESTGSIQVNTYHYRDHFTGDVLKFFEEVIPLMNIGNYDKSDIQSDYFNVGWYVDVNVGRWDRPYEVIA